MESTESLLEAVNTCYKNKEYKKALSLCGDIVENKKASKETLVDTFFIMANIFHLKGDLGKAIKAFKKVLSLDPSHTDASISLSVLYNDIGFYEEGKKIFKVANERVRGSQAVRDTPQDQHINKKFANKHFELAELYMTYNRFDEALFEYNKVHALDAENLDVRVKIAKVYAKKNFISKAFEQLRKLKTEHPEFVEARVALGVLYYGSGKIIEARSEWKNVLAKKTNHAEAAMYLKLSTTATETAL